MLHLYHGPLVKLRLNPSNREFTVSKDLLCAESKILAVMFEEGRFKESQQMEANLNEEEHIVSVRSVEALIQWIYIRVVKFDVEDPGENITAAMELVRLADLYFITGLETEMAQYIKKIIIANPGPKRTGTSKSKYDTLSERDTHWLNAEHIISATYLRPDHPVRQTLAAACVAGFIQHYPGKFHKLTDDYPSFRADLARQVVPVMKISSLLPSYRTFEDPISGEELEMGPETVFLRGSEDETEDFAR
ncbi:uncharacterized protein N7483_009037 [Penicillium malachiteum]|uniref:uncharacterized protein n=1 Tax=Penicillium malachiteum TaxID=1324776 RepID=UPI002547EF4A|nr:uncharacterized protein N7483_009037 [Penicillium malachiteum]KAJ5721103.1 hypothetical protein N7483_009037 [Penicillium malachiteum]